MKAARFYGGKDIRVETVPDPAPGVGEVLVRVRAAGICGSDLHGYRNPPAQPQPPRTPGHEIAGEIIAVGPGVNAGRIGERVAVEPLVGCGVCTYCLSGQYHLCAKLEHIGGARSGGFAELTVAPQDKAYPLPEGFSYEAGSLLDVLACGVHALGRVPVRPGDHVAVIGTGPIGLGIVQMAMLAGGTVAVLGRRAEPVEFAARLTGATGINTGAGNAAEAVRAWSGGPGANIVYEAVGGGADTLNLALEIAAPGGTVGVLGAYTHPQEINSRVGMRRELTLAWIWSYARQRERSEFQLALDLVATKKLQADPLVTHHFPLEQIGEAFATAEGKAASNAMKVIVVP